jgi:hypothetical protein
MGAMSWSKAARRAYAANLGDPSFLHGLLDLPASFTQHLRSTTRCQMKSSVYFQISPMPILKRPRVAFEHKTPDAEESTQAEKRPETSEPSSRQLNPMMHQPRPHKAPSTDRG